MRIGNTVREVRFFLKREERTSPLNLQPYLLAADLPITSRIERLTLAAECPRCRAKGRLCYAPTGLPASAPHSERIIRAGIFR